MDDNEKPVSGPPRPPNTIATPNSTMQNHGSQNTKSTSLSVMNTTANFGAHNQGFQSSGPITDSILNLYPPDSAESDESVRNKCLKSLKVIGLDEALPAQKRVQSTCRWIFRHEKYLSWLAKGGLLWVCGRAGSGKSVLMDNLAAEDRRKAKESETTKVLILSVFVDFSHKRPWFTCDLIQELLHQLFQNNEDRIPDFVASTNFKQRCKKIGKPGKAWSWKEKELQDAFDQYLEDMPPDHRVRLYVDGLNENDKESLPKILDLFQSFSVQTSRRMAICVSLRPHSLPDILDVDNGPSPRFNFEIDVRQENSRDIDKFIDAKLDSMNSGRSQKDLDQIKRSLVKRTDGVFLWVSTIMQPGGQFSRLVRSDEDVEYILKSLEAQIPSGLNDTYELILNEITGTREIQNAFRLLECLTLATKPLKIEDLRYFSCLEPSIPYRSKEQVIKSDSFCKTQKQLIDRVTRYLRGLVRTVTLFVDLGHSSKTPFFCGLDDVSRPHECFQFDHETVQAFMQRKGLRLLQGRLNDSEPGLSLGKQHLSMALRCLRYLGVKEIRDLAAERRFEQQLVENLFVVQDEATPLCSPEPFMLYAALQWNQHLSESSDNNNLIEEILRELKKLPRDFWPHVAKMRQIAKYGGWNEGFGSTTLLHIICASGLCNVLEGVTATMSLQQDELNARDEFGCTALLRAIEENQTRVVEHLLDFGADKSIPNHNDEIPLHFAAAWGNESIVKQLLVDAKSDVNVRDKWRRSPVERAMYAAQLAVVALFIKECQPHIHTREVVEYPFGPGHEKFVIAETPLINAWIQANPALIKVLLTGITIEGEFQGTKSWLSIPHCLSHYPPTGGWGPLEIECARLIIDDDRFLLNLQDDEGATPLHVAAAADFAEIVNLLLLQQSIDANIKNNEGRTPLMVAAANGSCEVLKVMLKSNKVDTELTTNAGFTALDIAVFATHLKCVEQLLPVGEMTEKERTIRYARTRQWAGDWIERVDGVRKDAANDIFQFVDSQYELYRDQLLKVRGEVAMVEFMLDCQDMINKRFPQMTQISIERWHEMFKLLVADSQASK